MATRTFVAVDQVGSTDQLVQLGDGPASVVRARLLSVLREAVAAHDGQEVDSAGDGILCVFDGAGEAVDAAVAMQRALAAANRATPEPRRTAVRVGVATGEPLRAPDGRYVGLAVVVAARLCARADAGQVLVADLVRSLVEPSGSHPFRAVGALSLKGVPSTVSTSAVEWEPTEAARPLPAAVQAARTTPLVGRDRELSVLTRAWAAATGGSPRVVVISGQRGSGATRLAAELARTAHAQGATVWYGAARPGGPRLSVWADALDSWMSEAPWPELRAVVAASADRLRLLDSRIEHLMLVAAAPGSPSSSGSDEELVADALDEVFERLSGSAPVVVVLDGLDEADATSLAVLGRLAASRRSSRLLLVACEASASASASRALAAVRGGAHVGDVHLQGLDVGAVSDLVTALTGERPPPPRARAILAESEGLPAFVVSTAVAHRTQGLARSVTEAADRAEGLRTDLRVRREEISLGLRELQQLRVPALDGVTGRVEPEGTPPADVPCPYRGLVAFGSDDAADFHGREELVAELVARLAASRLLAVVGPSGSGKSSAVRAGLLPAVAAGALPGEAWAVAVLRPGHDPVTALAEALSTVAGAAGGGAATLAGRLAGHPLEEVAAEVLPVRPLLLVVDQAEELWTVAAARSRDRFVDLVTAAVSAPSGSVRVVLALRADYYGRAATHRELAGLVTDSQVLVGPLTDAELRSVVEAPARRVGLVVEPGLAQAVVDDAAGQPGALPLVSTALLETWRRRRGRSLTLSGYAEAGGVRRAIAHLADATYDDLDEEEQAAARVLLLRLAAPGADGDDVARRVPLAEVGDDPVLHRVLARLTDRRLLTVGGAGVQVAHEALLREWPRLRSWLDADREGRKLHHQVTVAAGEWAAADRHEDLLLRGLRLSAASDWATTHEGQLAALEADFLAASQRGRDRGLLRARRTARRLKLLAGGLVAALVLAVGVTAYAVDQRGDAARRAADAELANLVARAESLAETDIATALLLAVEAHRRSASPMTESALLTTLEGARHIERQQVVESGTTEAVVLPVSGRLLSLVDSGAEGFAAVPLDARTLEPSGSPLAEGLNSLEPTLDGSGVAVMTATGVQVLDAVSGRPTSPEIPGDFASWAVSATGTEIAVVPEDRPASVVVHSTRDGTLIAEWDVEETYPLLQTVGGGDLLVTTTGPSTFATTRHRFDGSIITGPIPHEGVEELRLADASPDGAVLALLLANGELRLVDLVNGGMRASVPPGESGRQFFTWWSPDSTMLAVANDDGSVDVRAADDGRIRTHLQGTGAPVGAAFLDDARLVTFAESTATIFDLTRTAPIGTVVTGNPVVAVTGGGESTVLLAEPDRLVIRTVPALEEVDEVPLSGAVSEVDVSPNGRLVAVHSGLDEFIGDDYRDRGRLRVIDLDTGGVPVDVDLGTGPDGYPGGATQFSSDGQFVSATDAEGAVQLFDVDTGEASGEPFALGDVSDPAYWDAGWTADDRRLVAGGDGGVGAVDPSSGELLWRHASDANVFITGMVASEDGALVAVADNYGEITTLDGRTGEQVGPVLSTGDRGLLGVALTPGAQRVASLGFDGRLWLWDRVSGRLLGSPLSAHADRGKGLVMLGDTLITAGLDGSVISWPTDPAAWVERACAVAGRDLTAEQWAEHLPGQEPRSTCRR